MAENSEKARGYEGLQSVVGLVGITLGVIPFARWVVTGEIGGLFRWVFGSFAETLDYGAPLIVVAAAVFAIAALEIMKRNV